LISAAIGMRLVSKEANTETFMLSSTVAGVNETGAW